MTIDQSRSAPGAHACESSVKESPVPSFLQLLIHNNPAGRQARLPARGVLACCLLVLCTTGGLAVAQDAPSYAGPVQPEGWRLEEWRQHSLRYTTSLRVDRPNTQDKENLTRGVEYYLYGMTQPEVLEETIINLRRGLMIDLRSKLTEDAPRRYLLEEIVRISAELLDQPPGPRLNILILLAGLPTNQTPDDPVPYVPANEILLQVIGDPNQLVECKIWAAIGLGRISRDGNPNISVKNRIAVALVDALDSPEAQTAPAASDSADWWYRMRLLEALGDNGIATNVTQEPVVIDAIARIIIDPNEHWIIRSTAARACTQLDWEPATNVSLINHIICGLAHQMAKEYNQELAQNGEEKPYWRRCFLNTYLAYRPLTQAQRQRRWGLLQKGGGADVQAAYQLLLPVFNAVTRVVDAEAIPQPAIDAVEDWLGNNRPQDWKVTPASEDLDVSSSDAPGDPTTGPTGGIPETQQTGAVVGPAGS